jgi:diacylglycerol kinase (ATP)
VEWTLGLPASSNDADVVLIFGGDGTVHRHLGALVALKLPVLVVPCGSGNDFARALNLHSVKASLAAWKKFSAGANNVRAIDLGIITAIHPQGRKPFERSDEDATHAVVGSPDQAGNCTFFCCAGGVGLDGEIARRANRFPRWLRGHGGYLIGALPALLKFSPVSTKVMTPRNEGWEIRSDESIFVAVFANAGSYGGGMNIAPRAVLDDGKLDICVVRDLAKSRLFCLFPTVYFGRHLSIPEVDYFQVERLRLEPETPLDVYADGEYVCRTPIEVSLAPAVLQVIIA